MKKTVKRKRINTGNSTYNRLYTAVRDYVEKNGGTILVIGGTALIDEGEKNKYGIMVRCFGKKPNFPKNNL